jgi:hypothetical protein
MKYAIYFYDKKGNNIKIISRHKTISSAMKKRAKGGSRLEDIAASMVGLEYVFFKIDTMQDLLEKPYNITYFRGVK